MSYLLCRSNFTCVIQTLKSCIETKTGKIRRDVGQGWGCRGGRMRCEGKGKGKTHKTCFSTARAIYVHYFKNIRQGALQSNCVGLLGGLGLGMTFSWGFLKNVRGRGTFQWADIINIWLKLWNWVNSMTEYNNNNEMTVWQLSTHFKGDMQRYITKFMKSSF